MPFTLPENLQPKKEGFTLPSGIQPKTLESPKRGLKGEILPTAGSIVGGIGGGIVGGLVGGPPGAFAGAVGGAGLGGAAGEAIQEKIEGKISPQKILKRGAVEASFQAVGGIAGKVLKTAGKFLYKTAVPTSSIEANLLQEYKAVNPLWKRIVGITKGKAPVTAAETAFKKSLKGTETMLGIQARRAAPKLWGNLIEPQLKKSSAIADMDTFFDEVAEKIKVRTPEPNRQADLLEALNALRGSYKGKKATMYELQKFKEGWAEFVPEKAYKGKPIAGSFNAIKDIAAENARDRIYNILGPEVREAYLDYGNLKGIQELGQKAMTGGKLRGGWGGWFSAIKDMAITPVSTIGGRTLYRVGQVEFYGAPGLKVVGDLLGFKNEERQ